MIAQPSLFDQKAPTRLPQGVSIRTDFLRFHMENPHVYGEIVKLAREMKANNHERWGIKGIFEVLRWRYAIQTSGDECFKLDNRYTSHFARLVMEQEPDLKDFFQTREQRAG